VQRLRNLDTPWTWWVACDADRCEEVPSWARIVPCGPQENRWATDRYRRLLDLIDEGFVYGLDDDNALHPRFSVTFREAAHRYDGFCMPQEMCTLDIFQKIARRLRPSTKVRPTCAESVD